MPRLPTTEIRLRLIVEAPVPGLLTSLQKNDAPFDAKVSQSNEPLVFEFPVRVTEDGKLLGDFVRREGPVRRFVYLRIGAYAGDAAAAAGGRLKIDIHDIPPPLIEAGLAGQVIEGRFTGSRNGKSVVATIKTAWRAA